MTEFYYIVVYISLYLSGGVTAAVFRVSQSGDQSAHSTRH